MATKRGRGAKSKPAEAGPGPERIQKILARAGYGSRRACEILIVDGRVRVDGQFVKELGAKADSATQEIHVDNKPIRAEKTVYYLLNKPKGTLCTLSDPEGRRTVQDHLNNERRRVFPVGRLDMDSRGAVILTNDGRFTNLLTHPRYGVEKTYLARVRGSVDEGAMGKLRAGVWLAEGKTLPARVWVIKRKSDETELGMAICEGKNRQVRRMLATVGYKVQALTRTRVGPITLKGLREGDYRELTADEVEELTKIAKRNAGAPAPPWAKGRSSRARSLGKPDPSVRLGEGEPAHEPAVVARRPLLDEPAEAVHVPDEDVLEEGDDEDAPRPAPRPARPDRSPHPLRADSDDAPPRPSRRPAGGAPRGPAKGPSRGPAKGPSRGPAKGPSSRGPAKGPSSRGPARAPRGPHESRGRSGARPGRSDRDSRSRGRPR